jgi:dTMP kinase
VFITFEGVEGSGKSLQVDLAAAHLRRRGVACLVTREPGGTPFGASVREILLRAGGPHREPMSELLLYLADRHQHLKEVIEPSLRKGLTVISDRYHDATRAYQGAARGIDSETIDRLAAALGIREPDRTFLLDIDPLVGLQRACSRNVSSGSDLAEGRFEAEGIDFHREVRRAYLELARLYPERIFVVEACGSPEVVHARVRVLLDEWLPGRGG